MIFISLVKSKERAIKGIIAKGDKFAKQLLLEEGIKLISQYCTLGSYDLSG